MEQHSDLQISEPLRIEGVLNVRGFGGVQVSSPPGFVTRKNRIIRSGHLENLTPNGHAQLTALNVSRIVDLRNTDESTKATKFHGESTASSQVLDLKSRKISLPLQTGSFSAADKLLFYRSSRQDRTKVTAADYFRMLTSEEGITALNGVLSALLQNPADRVLIHCTLGKDRTGLIIAILLSLAGVSDAEIGKDYHLSENELQTSRERMKSYIRSLDTEIDETEATAIAAEVFRTEEAYILQTLQLIRETFGTVEQLICSQCQWQAKDVDMLKWSLIEKCDT